MEFLVSRSCFACLIFCLLLASCHTRADGVAALPPKSLPLCSKLLFSDLISIPKAQCPLEPYPTGLGIILTEGVDIVSAVSEIDGSTLDTVLSFLQNGDTYAAVLFYAKWCPFSRALRPMFDSLSIRFPMIRHIAIESSAFWPSMLSQHGVHSFPSLFLQNKTVRVKYQGRRTVEHLSQFYKDSTGLEPIDLSKLTVEEVVLSYTGGAPQSQNLSVGMWVREDVYLTLASVFLLCRLLISIVPRIFVSMKKYLIKKEASQQPTLVAEVQQCETLSRRYKGKSPVIENREAGKGVMSVPGWSSSSLAAVALAESSSSRAGIPDDARDIAYVHRRHVWG